MSPKIKKKFNGRKFQQRQRGYELRTRDFASGCEIKKSDRGAWNRTLNKSGQERLRLVGEAQWVEIMKETDEKGDVLTVYEGVA